MGIDSLKNNLGTFSQFNMYQYGLRTLLNTISNTNYLFYIPVLFAQVSEQPAIQLCCQCFAAGIPVSG